MTTTPTIHLTPCTSAALVAHGYDASTRTLAVQFKAGHAPHLYRDVPPEAAEGLATAESKGKYLAAHIRGKYQAPKAEAEA
ncbi:MAG: hypothetical protein RLZZ182_195 [Pseudomonadota bacterium]|jgi:hypothetical protein